MYLKLNDKDDDDNDDDGVKCLPGVQTSKKFLPILAIPSFVHQSKYLSNSNEIFTNKYHLTKNMINESASQLIFTVESTY